VRSFAGLIRASLLLAAIAAFAPIAAADPYEADPDLATRDDDYAAGKQAVERKDWAEAARLFQRAEIRHPDHADLQNILGFSYRNLKQYELAFKHYRRAIELDPRHRGAHEYIGETYLMTGDLAGAERHLAALKEICLLPCEELKDLERAIAEYRGRKLSLSRIRYYLSSSDPSTMFNDCVRRGADVPAADGIAGTRTVACAFDFDQRPYG
jgi:tetratricopeptide (TPR) repeat protein